MFHVLEIRSKVQVGWNGFLFLFHRVNLFTEGCQVTLASLMNLKYYRLEVQVEFYLHSNGYVRLRRNFWDNFEAFHLKYQIVLEVEKTKEYTNKH
jgi:hypothetical protein